MPSIYTESWPRRLWHALKSCLTPSGTDFTPVWHFLKAWVRFPMVAEADRVLHGLPVVSFADCFPTEFTPDPSVLLGSLKKHAWNASLEEEVYLGLIVQSMRARRIFEIGTFDGSTTKFLARVAGPGAELFTLDLPPAEFDSKQKLVAFSGAQVGRAFRDTPWQEQITQLLGNSTGFDFTPYEKSMDLVFVDAAHDYVHGLADARSALQLVRPGGVIVFDDFCSGWPGLVHGICEATRGLPLKRLGGTALGILQC